MSTPENPRYDKPQLSGEGVNHKPESMDDDLPDWLECFHCQTLLPAHASYCPDCESRKLADSPEAW